MGLRQQILIIIKIKKIMIVTTLIILTGE